MEFGRLYPSLKDTIHDITAGKKLPDLSKIAYGYFTRASMERPASISGQAALIVMWCKSEGYSPNELGSRLEKDAKRIDTIVGIANRAHEAGNVGRVRVNPSLVKDIVEKDFHLAQRMMVLEPGDLVLISRMYQGYQTRGYWETAYEGFLRKEVDAMIDARNQAIRNPKII